MTHHGIKINNKKFFCCFFPVPNFSPVASRSTKNFYA